MIAFAVGQAEQAFFQNRIAAVPERQREAQTLLIVADAEQSVLAPAIGPAAGMIVAEVPPRPCRSGVVLADRAPLAVAEVRAPQLPPAFRRFVQTRFFFHGAWMPPRVKRFASTHSNLVKPRDRASIEPRTRHREESIVDVIGLIAAHGYWIVLVVAFVDQFGAPIPSIAVLLAAGAVAGQGQITVIGVLGSCVAGDRGGRCRPLPGWPLAWRPGDARAVLVLARA